MLPKCIMVLLLLSFIEFVYPYGDTYQPCRPLKLDNGRVRPKQRNRLVKFLCAPSYELVGDRYATCRNGRWDSPLPVCVRPGCMPLPIGPNSIALREHHGAWVVTFCLPGYKLEGSSAIYCDGYKWNDTAPQCVETTLKSSLSCDFEDPAICGWTQDELHDFDWKRWNEKTPSNFILTGPSFDHTYGENKLGYYMYIESSAKVENASARLLSPVYDYSLTTDGCFQFFYHMYGKDMGGLRVYQKPISLQLIDMLNLPEVEQKYLLFKVWGNQGNTWYSDVTQLKPMVEDFQIVVEGVRGSSFISDIAIDDVSILRGDACAAARRAVSTPPPAPPGDFLSCAGRCSQPAGEAGCGCHFRCLLSRNCCPDFLDICFSTEETDLVSTSTETLPETQKLVGETTTTILTTPKTSTTITLKPTTTKDTTPKPTSPKSTTPKITTPKLTTPKPTTPKSTTPKPTTPKPTTPKLTTPKPTTPKLTTPKPTTAQATTIKTTPRVTTTVTTPKSTHETSTIHRNTTEDVIEKNKAEAQVNLNKMVTIAKSDNKSGTWKTAVVTIVLLALSLSLIFVALSARTARGRQAIARLRGRTCHDSEVRYLNSADNDDL